MMKRIFSFMLLLLLSLTVFAACSTKTDMEDLPSGELLTTSNSPDGTYCFNAYLCSDDGELYVRGEVVTVETNESRNIYWDKYSDTVDVRWTNDSLIVINNISLDVVNDTYDCFDKE